MFNKFQYFVVSSHFEKLIHMIESIEELLSSNEFWANAIIQVLFLGILIFAFHKYFEHKLEPLTAAETLKRQNFLNAKKEVYYEAIDLANREYAFMEFTDSSGKIMTNYSRDRGTKKPTEYEVNTCFSKLCIYSDDRNILKLYKKLFLYDPKGKPIQVLEDFVNLLRKDLGYGEGIITPRTNEYEYISIGIKDTTNNK